MSNETQAPTQASLSDATASPTSTTSSPKERRRVVFATVVGTTVEWYDFFVYASAAGLVFSQLFFQPAGPAVATILSFITVGISFLFRPLGAFLAGHFGDKYGRRVVLMVTLITMGVATALIGLLPTYHAVGVGAPIMLILLRVIQGISAGGEWGGAALLAVEHAPTKKRGLFGAAPQLGVPLGLLLASAVMAVMTMIAPGDAFLAWGWRIPFLLSIVLILVGHYIRRNVEESPVYNEIAERKDGSAKMPILELFRRHSGLVMLAAFVFVGNNAVGYMTTGGYLQNYATNPDGPLGFDRGPVLWAVTASAVNWLAFTWISGWLSDKLGRRNTYLLGYTFLLGGVIILFPMINSGSLASFVGALLILTVGLGLTYGPQASFYAELFPASIRFSGVSISYAIGAILGGAFSPTIAAWLMELTGSTTSITIYLSIMVIIAFIATSMLKDRSGIPLGPDHEAEQQVSPIRG